VQTFEFREMIRVLGMSAATGKNFTSGRPFKLKPSIRTATGQGSRNLYSLGDVWLMGVANELSKAGMAASAIGKLVGALRTKFTHGLGAVDALFISRWEKLGYRIETRENRLPVDTVVRLTINVRALRATVDLGVRKLRKQ
jgi:hypothetical protein